MGLVKDLANDPGMRFAWGNAALLAANPGMARDIAILGAIVTTGLTFNRGIKGADNQSVFRNPHTPLIVNGVLVGLSGVMGLVSATTAAALAGATAFASFGPANILTGTAYAIAAGNGEATGIRKLVLKVSDYIPPALTALGFGCVALATALTASGGGWMQALVPAMGSVAGGILSLLGRAKMAWLTYTFVNIATGAISLFNAWQALQASDMETAKINLGIGVGSLLFAAATFRLAKLEEQKLLAALKQ